MGKSDETKLAELLKHADWEDLTPRLLAYALFLLSRRDMPKERAHKYVTQAVYEVLEGKYRPPDVQKSLFNVLASVVGLLVEKDANSARPGS